MAFGWSVDLSPLSDKKKKEWNPTAEQKIRR